jgi:hypothetical protein
MVVAAAAAAAAIKTQGHLVTRDLWVLAAAAAADMEQVELAA